MKRFAALETLAVAFAATLVLILTNTVDLVPSVETEFFFAEDDPQLQATNAIGSRFSSSPQVLFRALAPDIRLDDYRSDVGDLAARVREIDGVTGVNSIANTDAFNSPLWGALLVSPSDSATYLIATIDPAADQTQVVADVEAAAAAATDVFSGIQLSGVPYVIEKIRQNLFRDLVVFSLAALVVFGTVVAGVYRRVRIVTGTILACVSASALTLILSEALGISVGLLTANIATIVFVLTLSHIVFLTSNWRATADAGEPSVRRAIQLTRTGSFWAMATTLLGFLSLLLATAKPLRELGLAGSLGATVAIVVSYTLYPVFLLRSRPAKPLARGGGPPPLPIRHRGRWWIAFAIVAVLGLTGVFRLSTDPSLLSYFDPGGPLKEGLEAIDSDGGSSPLSMVVQDRAGATVDDDRVVANMRRLHEALMADSSVGVTLSPVAFFDEARRQPFMGALSFGTLLDVPFVARLAQGWIPADRRDGLFFMRMREGGRTEPRAEVVERIQGLARSAQLEPTLTGGLYELQGQLGLLLASSLRIGLTGLLLLFVGVGVVVSRSPRTALLMVGTLCLVPLVVLGTFGHFGIAIDIISSPAANVALAMGVDSMIHLVVRARRLETNGTDRTTAWLEARRQLWQPIVGAAFIISAGFGIFALSTFPPTQRFGLAVILGTLTAAVMSLVALPMAVVGSNTPQATGASIASGSGVS